jgi:23S rRNA (guanosine2251-2'-O)-methyltransferase
LELLTEPVAMVVGAEGTGLSVLSKKRCDMLASIPMAASFESLNASVSAALACFEIMRVRAESDLSLQSDGAPG